MMASVYNKDDLERHGDQVKDLILYALFEDGWLTEAQIENWSKTHVVLVKKVSLISQWYRKLVSQEEPTDFRFIVATIPEIRFGPQELRDKHEGEPDGTK